MPFASYWLASCDPLHRRTYQTIGCPRVLGPDELSSISTATCKLVSATRLPGTRRVLRSSRCDVVPRQEAPCWDSSRRCAETSSTSCPRPHLSHPPLPVLPLPHGNGGAVLTDHFTHRRLTGVGDATLHLLVLHYAERLVCSPPRRGAPLVLVTGLRGKQRVLRSLCPQLCRDDVLSGYQGE